MGSGFLTLTAMLGYVVYKIEKMVDDKEEHRIDF